MTVKQALKAKGKLLLKMNNEFNKVLTYNSVNENSDKPYSSSESLDNYFRMNEELIELKTKIHLANVSVYGKIFTLSELKSQLGKLNSLDCTSGMVNSYYGSDVVTIKVAEIDILKRDSIIQGIEDSIEKLQDELDDHNATTNI